MHDVLVALVDVGLVVDVPAKGLKEGIEKFPAKLRFVVLVGAKNAGFRSKCSTNSRIICGAVMDRSR